MMDDDSCPVCGRDVIEVDRIPEHPSPEHEPHAPGHFFIHRREEVKKGYFEQSGCSMYENGEVDRWEPDDSSETVREADDK